MAKVFTGTLKHYLELVYAGGEYEDENVQVCVNYDVNEDEPPEVVAFSKKNQDHRALYDEHSGWFCDGPHHADVVDWVLPEDSLSRVMKRLSRIPAGAAIREVG